MNRSMQETQYLGAVLACAALLTVSAAGTCSAARSDVDVAPTEYGAGIPFQHEVRVVREAPATVMSALWDNGPLVTGVGTDGVDVSVLQTSLGMNTYGFGFQATYSNEVADDFRVPAGKAWMVTGIVCYAYQVGSTITSTLDTLHVRIWDDVPTNPGAQVVWGDLLNNRLVTSDFAGIYRTSESNPNQRTRPIMSLLGDVQTTLTSGTYWLNLQVGGTLPSGPWAPPITILGQTNTGNAVWYLETQGGWQPALDSGILTTQDFPFLVLGKVVPPGEARTATVSKLKYTINRATPGKDSLKFIATMELEGSDLPYALANSDTCAVTIAGVDFLANALPLKVAKSGKSAKYALPDPKQGKVKVKVLSKKGVNALQFKVVLKNQSNLGATLGVPDVDAKKKNALPLNGTDILIIQRDLWGEDAVDSKYWGKLGKWTKGKQ